MACWWPTLRAETSRQVTNDCKAIRCVWLWMLICNCDWYTNGDISNKDWHVSALETSQSYQCRLRSTQHDIPLCHGYVFVDDTKSAFFKPRPLCLKIASLLYCIHNQYLADSNVFTPRLLTFTRLLCALTATTNVWSSTVIYGFNLVRRIYPSPQLVYDNG